MNAKLLDTFNITKPFANKQQLEGKYLSYPVCQCESVCAVEQINPISNNGYQLYLRHLPDGLCSSGSSLSQVEGKQKSGRAGAPCGGKFIEYFPLNWAISGRAKIISANTSRGKIEKQKSTNNNKARAETFRETFPTATNLQSKQNQKKKKV